MRRRLTAPPTRRIFREVVTDDTGSVRVVMRIAWAPVDMAGESSQRAKDVSPHPGGRQGGVLAPVASRRLVFLVVQMVAFLVIIAGENYRAVQVVGVAVAAAIAIGLWSSDATLEMHLRRSRHDVDSSTGSPESKDHE